ncbi:MAG: hypothetical protein PHQ43_09765, partial [Dehalococcoidales bacterium]|nr:hypothetical protein [Dehalococcoidales bacterium]
QLVAVLLELDQLMQVEHRFHLRSLSLRSGLPSYTRSWTNKKGTNPTPFAGQAFVPLACSSITGWPA